VEHLDCDQEHLKYLAAAWLRELAIKLATRDGLTVSAVTLRLTPAIPSVLQSACPWPNAITQ